MLTDVCPLRGSLCGEDCVAASRNTLRLRHFREDLCGLVVEVRTCTAILLRLRGFWWETPENVRLLGLNGGEGLDFPGRVLHITESTFTEVLISLQNDSADNALMSAVLQCDLLLIVVGRKICHN